MKYLLTLLLLCAFCPGTGAAAQNASHDERPVAPDTSRFLFIVETTSATRGLQEANRTALFDMIFTGLGGQMRTGDTFGIWTYNQETYAGQFPMQSWDAQNAMELASRATLFLSGQNYGGDARIELLAAKIRGVTRAVGDVTIFVLSDGSAKFAEIPYFDAINTEYRQRAKERSRAKKPFVTALIARGGKVVGAYVALAGQPLPLPERAAPEVDPMKMLRPTVPVSPKRAPATVVPSIPPIGPLVPETGATTAPELKRPVVTPDSTAETKSPDVVVTITPPPVPAFTPPSTPVPTTPARLPKVFQFVTQSNTSAPKLESAPVEAALAPTNPPPAPIEITNPAPVIAKIEPPVVTPPPVTSSPPIAVLPSVSTAPPVTTSPPVAAVSPMITAPPVASMPPIAIAPPVTTVSPAAAMTPASTAPPIAATPAVPGTPKPISSTVAARLPRALPVAARELDGTGETSRTLEAVAVPAMQGLSAGAQLGMGGLLLCSAVFLIVVTLRRARPAPQPSLITRSMERR